MEFSPKIRRLIGVVTKILAIGVGGIVLMISVARAGWETRAISGSDAVPGNNLIEYNAVFDDGTTAVGNYKLPETGMLPDNMFYGMKKIRNSLWLLFSHGPGKIKMAILLADKSAAESEALIAKEEVSTAIEAGNEAVDKLEYAETLINQIKVADSQTKQLHYQIFWAGYAYREVFKEAKDSFDMDITKYENLINRIDDWNKKQEENRYSWEN